MRKMKAALLVLDYNLYPRSNVDRHNVIMLKDAIATGSILPPVKVDKKSKRVTDGFHRTIAVLETNENGEIDVIECAYKNEREMFLDAMRLNAQHGAKLDPHDRNHCVLISERLKIPIELVAGALHMPTDKLANLRDTRTAKTAGGLSVPLKQTIKHMAGQKLTVAQQKANERSSGMNQVFYVNQLVDLIENDLLDKENEKLLERLRHLSGLLESLLVV